MKKNAYTPSKEVTDDIATKILIGRGIAEIEAESLIKAKKAKHEISALTAEHIRELLDNNSNEYDEGDFKYTATSGSRKFGGKI